MNKKFIFGENFLDDVKIGNIVSWYDINIKEKQYGIVYKIKVDIIEEKRSFYKIDVFQIPHMFTTKLLLTVTTETKLIKL